MKLKVRTLQKSELFALSKFVAEQNFIHHNFNVQYSKINHESRQIYFEELSMFDFSRIYVICEKDEIVGSIRVTKYNETLTLPIQKLYGINPTEYLKYYSCIWHVGRFAVVKGQSFLVFKQLMTYAIKHIVAYKSSALLVECDAKLSKIFNYLKIDYKIIGSPIYYLGSKTLPLLIEGESLKQFYADNKYLMGSKTTHEDSLSGKDVLLPLGVEN